MALVLAPRATRPPPAEGAAPPEGYGTLPEEALVRSIVTDELTGRSSSSLISQTGRDAVEKSIKTRILKSTDVAVSSVMLTDIAVQ